MISPGTPQDAPRAPVAGATAARRAQGVRRAPDASMDLLKQVQRDALDPGYAAAAGRGEPRRRWLGILGVALASGLMALAAVQTSGAAPAAQSERTSLVDQVKSQQQAQDATRARIAQLQSQVAQLQQSQGAPTLDAGQVAAAGMGAVVGPGIKVSVDDSAQLSGKAGAQVGDEDLRQLVNGLWAAGAEAVSLNGHRVTARTAIRMAGSAITVDYRSLDRPYVVQAIGDPDRLADDFSATRGGQWWHVLTEQYGMGMTVQREDELHLAADPGLSTKLATKGG